VAGSGTVRGRVGWAGHVRGVGVSLLLCRCAMK
jgi:hypothetical protein